MPGRDGIETIRHLQGSYNGKAVMISQVEAKEMVGEAYSLGIEYFIHKPINKIEIVTVLRKVKERIELETSIGDIQHSLTFTDHPQISPVMKMNDIASIIFGLRP